MILLAAAAALAMKGEPPITQATPGRRKSDWVVDSLGGGLARYYPDLAVRTNVEGYVLLRCGVKPPGRLDNCEVVKETPPGFGFGEAALRMAPLFKRRVDLPEHPRAEDQTASLPLSFKLPRNFEPVMFKTFRIRIPGLPAGHAEVSCQVFAGRLDNCSVAMAERPELEAPALKAARDFVPGDLPLGMRLTLPFLFEPPEQSVQKP